ncbi:MAG: metallopeptidase TldD-related protein [Nitrospiraceae bacterium]
MSQGLTSREEFEFLADLVMRHRSAEHAAMWLQDIRSGTTRVADNRVIQNLDTRKVMLRVQVASGRRQGSATTTSLTAGAVQDAFRRAERIAQVVPEDPEWLPPVGPETFIHAPTWVQATSSAGPTGRLDAMERAILLCRQAGVSGAGIVATSVATVGVATSAGLRIYEPRTDARFSLTATANNASGWAANAHRAIDRLGIDTRTATAIEKCRMAHAPRELQPGRYTVILEPAAVAGLLGGLIWQLDGKAYDKGTSALSGKVGSPVLDARFTLRNSPEHQDLLASSFTADGLANRECTWIDRGRLRRLAYDRFTAQTHGVEPSPFPDALCLSAESLDATAQTLDALIAGTERGILVTNLWYIRLVNPTDLTLTGMTRDGTFLIEQGKIQGAVKNFRFHDSPLRVFTAVDGYTMPHEAVTAESQKCLVPAMRVRDFNFSSVTKF